MTQKFTQQITTIVIITFAFGSSLFAKPHLDVLSNSPALETKLYISGLVNMAKAKRLYAKRYWSLLLHYKKKSIGGVESEADGNNFFMAKDGKFNPKSELQATLESFFQNPPKHHNLHPICRFPLRLRWLKKELSINKQFLPKLDCKFVKAARRVIKFKSASLVFSSFYANAPASMFGHTLLKINANDNDNITAISLLDYAINFAAYPGDLDPISYAWLGLTGGYPGKFTILPYHMKVREYGDIENRDLWEYKLNLTEKEIERIILHTLELTQTHFDYFYLNENCSYHLLSLLEIARPTLNLTNKFRPAVLPSETIKQVAKENNLVRNILYRPSIYSQIRIRVRNLSKQQQKMFFSLLTITKSIAESRLENLPIQERALMIDTLLNSLRYLDEKKRRTSEQNSLYRSLIKLRIKIKSDDIVDYGKIISDTFPPHSGHEIFRLKLGLGKNSWSSFTQISFRSLFHDLLNSGRGFAPGSEFSFLNFEFRKYRNEKKLDLNEFNFLKIISFVPYEQINNSFSYYIEMGSKTIYLNNKRSYFLDDYFTTNPLQNIFIENKGNTNTHIKAKASNLDIVYGLSFADVYQKNWMEGFLFSILAGVNVQNSHYFTKQFRVAPQLYMSILYDLGKLKLQYISKYLAYSTSNNDDDILFNSLEISYSQNLNFEYRINLQAEKLNKEAIFSINYLF